MASLTHTQTRSINGSSYRVVDTTTASENMVREVFVFAVDGSVYNRIATVADIETLPTTLLEAQNQGLHYYRQSSVTRDFTLLAEANAFATEVKARLQALVIEYNAAATLFIGSESLTITS